MQAVEALLPNALEDVRQVAELLRTDWQWSIAFERQLSDRLPQLHAALERGRRRLLMRVLTFTSATPWEPITPRAGVQRVGVQRRFPTALREGVVRDLASGEVARLIGACPINWKPKPPDVGQ